MLSRILHPYMFIYIATVVVVNIGFSYIGKIDIGFATVSPMAFVVGATFVVRDFAQREAGHYVLVAMLVATILTFALADPFVAIASVSAFLVSEVGDWLLYTITKKPFHKRVLISSLVGTPLDTAVFLSFLGSLDLASFLVMTGSKLVAAVAIYIWYRAPTKKDEYAFN